MKRFLTFAALALLVGACGSTPASESLSPSAAAKQTFDLTMTNWTKALATIDPKNGWADGPSGGLNSNTEIIVSQTGNGEGSGHYATLFVAATTAARPNLSAGALMETSVAPGCMATVAGSLVDVTLDTGDGPDMLKVPATPLSGTLFGYPAFGRSIAVLKSSTTADTTLTSVFRIVDFCTELNGRILYYRDINEGEVTSPVDVMNGAPAEEVANSAFGLVNVPTELANGAPVLVSAQ